MRKITLEDKHNKKKLTLYIADDAFEDRALPIEKQKSNLGIISEKLFIETQGQRIVYLSAITLSEPEQTEVSFKFNDITNGVEHTDKITDLTRPNQTHQIQIQDLVAEGSSYCQPQNMQRNLFKKILLDKRVCDEQEVDTLLACLLDDPATNLQAIKQEIFSDVPKDLPAEIFNELNEPVDKVIASISRSITCKRADFVEMVENIICCRSSYHNAILPLASEIYGAAKSYYFEIWKQHGNNSKKLHQEREKFNELFNGIAHIDAEFNISSIKKTIVALGSRSKKLDELERTIAELLHNAYKKNESAFNFLLTNLKNDESGFHSVAGTTVPWTWAFSFTNETKNLYYKYNESINKVYDLPLVGYFVDLTDTLKKKVEAGRIQVRETASRSKQNQQPAMARYAEEKRESARKQQRQERHEKIERNKATIISVCVGAAIAIGAGLAFALLSPLALPVLAMAGIIAAGALVIMGVSAIIGRIIDTCKPAAKETVMASTKERKSLANDFKEELNSKNGRRTTPFLAERSAYLNNNLHKSDAKVMIPAENMKESMNAFNYK